MAPESLTALPRIAATTEAQTPAFSVGMRSYRRAIGRPRYLTRNTMNATATGMTATQNELVVTPRLARALRSMMDTSGSRPSLPTRSNRRPRCARWPSGRARSSRPNAVTAATVASTPSTTVRTRTR